MAIVSVLESEESGTGEINWKFQRTYKRIFKVQTSAYTDDASVVSAAVDPHTGLAIPALASSYPYDILALVEKISANKVSGQRFHWIVNVDYNSVFDINPLTMTENPLLRPPIVSYDWEKNEKFVRQDLDDNDISNSADTPYDPPLSINYGTKIISIEKNYATVPFAAVADLAESTNLDTWTDPVGISYEPDTLCIRGVKCNLIWENNQLYWKANWTIAYRSMDYDGWRPTPVLDQGYYEKLDDGTVRLIRDKFGAPMPQPSLLNGVGKVTSTPHYLNFTLRKQVTFTGMI